jgi:hypothetical protein
MVIFRIGFSYGFVGFPAVTVALGVLGVVWASQRFRPQPSGSRTFGLAGARGAT